MRVLILNSGSSSLKIKLLEMPAEHEAAYAMVERIGEAGARLIWRTPAGAGSQEDLACTGHAMALSLALDTLAARLPALPPIDLAGHRLVHGGELFKTPVLVDDAVLNRIESLEGLAPLHMPPALAVLRACRQRLPGIPQAACFDTAFHAGMPAKSFRYAVPEEWYRVYGVRRYGFHGLSHQFVTLAAAQMLAMPLEQLTLVSAHLGNGASVTAFERGRVLDTSMGFTPLEGLIMGTRAGYLDPAALQHLQQRSGMSLDRMIEQLNSNSGLAGVSGLGKDLRVIMEARRRGDARAELAVAMYVHTLRKYIGAYLFALGGARAVVFTGGVGENACELRRMTLEGLEQVGIRLDLAANRAMVGGRCGEISASRSPVKILVIPTNEEAMIARLACQLHPDQDATRSLAKPPQSIAS